MSSSFGFFTLPAELRASVYEHLKGSTLEHEDHSHFKSYVRVCREWQLVFEESSFRRVILNQYNLTKFDTLVIQDERRRAFVREIVLMVQFPAYENREYNRDLDKQIALDNDKTFLEALREFTRVMSNWRRVNGQGIAFELGGYSPSDKYHMNHEKDISMTKGPVETTEKRQYLPFKCSACNRSRATIMDSSMDFGEGSFFEECLARFEPVPAIESLAVCRSTTRIVSPTILNPLMERSLPNLREFRHETWQSRNRMDRRRFQESYSNLFREELPENTDRVHFFSETTTGCFPDAFPSLLMTGNVETSVLGSRWLTLAAQNLRVLSAPYIIDARNFFFGLHPSITPPERFFPRLERVNLTFSPPSPADRMQSPFPASQFIEDLVEPVTTKMPALKLMELWSLDKTQCAVLRYERLKDDEVGLQYWSSIRGEVTWDDEAFDLWAMAVEEQVPPKALMLHVNDKLKVPENYVEFLRRYIKQGNEVLGARSRDQVKSEYEKLAVSPTKSGLNLNKYARHVLSHRRT